jgi:hypothetical protein
LDFYQYFVTDANSTYNHCYSDTVQKRRQDKYMAALVKAHETASREHILQGVKCSILDRGTFHEEIAKAVKLHSETFAAEEALESLLAIYEVYTCSSLSLAFIVSD